MASPRRPATGSLKDELLSHPYRFEFFQAVRLLRIIRRQELGSGQAARVGEDAHPDDECVRLKCALTHQFPAVEVAELTWPADQGVPEMSVAVMGLYGPMGVLPLHDTQRMIDDRNTPSCERDFLDLFNHRILALFYRSWSKHFLPVNYEESFAPAAPLDTLSLRREPKDVISYSFLALAGVGLSASQDQLALPDTALAFFAGHFSRQTKSASSLAQMIESLFQVQVQVRHFVGRWLHLDAVNRSEMATPDRLYGQNAELGRGFVLGDRVWDVGSQFRLILGPVNYDQMLSFCPWGDQLKRLAEFTRCYVGVHLEFDIQLELLADEIPTWELGGFHALGANVWLSSIPPTHNSLDAVFQVH